MFFCSTCGIIIPSTNSICPTCSGSLTPTYQRGLSRPALSIPAPSTSVASYDAYGASRPTGVTILAIFYFIGCGFSVLGGLGVLLGASVVAGMVGRAQSSGSDATNLVLGAGAAVLAVIFFGFALLWGLLGRSLWRLQNWARIVTIVFCIVGVLRALLALGALLKMAAHPATPAVGLFELVILIVYGLIAWYLLKADVKAAF